jgi:hypothetical protein
MNKAAFLDILNHVSSISEQEVIELEKLALNFPYCQSAHLLLAKAAYDRGSMLSNQRLRRAAACAANRQLLKKLIYTSGMNLVLEPLHANGETEAAQTDVIPVLEPIEAEPLEMETYHAPAVEMPAPAAILAAEPLASPSLDPIEAETLELDTQDIAPAPEDQAGAETLHPEQPPVAEIASLTEIYEIPDLLEESDITALLQTSAAQTETEPALTQQPDPLPAVLSAAPLPPDEDEDLDDLFAVVMAGPTEPLPAAVVATQPQPEEPEDQDDLFAVHYLASLVASGEPVMAFVNTLEVKEAVATTQADAEEAALLAATEPVAPVSPTALAAEEAEGPALAPGKPETVEPGKALAASEPEWDEAVVAADAEKPLPVAATEPGEVDQTLTEFDQYLFTPEKEEEALAGSPAGATYQEEIVYKVFDANDLGYWMDSSRLGETLLRKNELATAQPYFFRPELLLEYSRHHEIASYQSPDPSVLTRQLDIIDQFLKLNPKIKSLASLKIKPESQEDLSLKSTKIRKSLASETLANILVQQGKIKKAIKIYEHLILKLPEKKDYFASQIEKLQNIT